MMFSIHPLPMYPFHCHNSYGNRKWKQQQCSFYLMSVYVILFSLVYSCWDHNNNNVVVGVLGFQPPVVVSYVQQPQLQKQTPQKSSSGSLHSKNYYYQQLQPTTTTSTKKCTTTTQLYSLQKLVDDTLVAASSTAATAATTKTQQQTIFVGGKGGVGKTTVSSALAVLLASSTSSSSPLKILIVSTDPAHSLGDALDIDLRKNKKLGQVIRIDNQNTEYSMILDSNNNNHELYACEVDANVALDEFRSNVQSFDVSILAKSLGVPMELLQNLGLNEFSSILNNPPPGLDELIALANVFDTPRQQQQQPIDGSTRDSNTDLCFDIIVVDTAPTGHTLRLLALPQFLDGLLDKLIKVRKKLNGITSMLQGFLGSTNTEQQQEQQRTITETVNRIETFRTKMSNLRQTLQNSMTTKFVVVTVPTKLGIAESKRLITELQQQQITVSDIVINQCVQIDDSNSNDENESESDPTTAAATAGLIQYYNRRRIGQTKWIQNLQQALDRVSMSPEYQNNESNQGSGGGSSSSSSSSIALTKVPFFDVELVGIPALGYVGSQIYKENPHFQHLLDNDSKTTSAATTKVPKVIICGGKGGVGKTTTSTSLAITLAASGGHHVALISTDPAHSLGDAVDMDLRGGQLIDCSLVGVPNNTGEGSLAVLEIDPTAAIQQFKGVVDQLLAGIGSSKSGGGGGSTSNAGLSDTLRDLQSVFDTLPAGTDEVVALAWIVQLVKTGKYDRIVLDTAPTGHTLRMLSTPGFLADFIDRILNISDKINNNPAVKLILATSGRSQEEITNAVAVSKSTLLSFQFQMYALEDLFTNVEQTEFLIVTIPTELAVKESIRLLNDLTYEAPEQPIKVRNVVVNQVLADDDTNVQTFLSHLHRSQRQSIEELERSCTTDIVVTKVPYLDAEPRGAFGLRMLGAELVKEDDVSTTTTTSSTTSRKEEEVSNNR